MTRSLSGLLIRSIALEKSISGSEATSPPSIQSSELGNRDLPSKLVSTDKIGPNWHSLSTPSIEFIIKIDQI